MQQETPLNIIELQCKTNNTNFLNLTAFKRLRVNFESKAGCLYFFEKRSLTTDFLPTKEDSKTLYKSNVKRPQFSQCYFIKKNHPKQWVE